MRYLWIKLGRLLFWLSWPLLYVYLLRGMRTRVLIVCGSDILAVKGWLGSGKWLLPGGGLHRHEDPLLGAIREVREEVGLDLTSNHLTLLGVMTTRQSGLSSKCYNFVVEITTKAPLKLQKFEILAARWLPIDQLPDSETGNDIKAVVAAWKNPTKAATL